MVFQEKQGSGRSKHKNLSLGLICLILPLLLSCQKSGTGTASGAATGAGTGSDWRITIIIGETYLPLEGETPVSATIRDNAGSPAPQGTMVCFTAVRGDFLKSGSSDGYATICEATTNDRGVSVQTYRGTEVGRDNIFVSALGVVQGAEIIVYEP